MIEDIQDSHTYLDQLEIPRKDKLGNEFTLMGRIQLLERRKQDTIYGIHKL